MARRPSRRPATTPCASRPPAGRVSRAMAWVRTQDRPTRLACKTIIDKGAGPKEGDPHGHGYSLFDKEIAEARQAMEWPWAPFVIPDEIAKPWKAAGRRGARRRRAWEVRLKADPAHAEFERAMRGELPRDAFVGLAAHIDKLVASP